MAEKVAQQVTVEKSGQVRVIPAELEQRYTQQLGWSKVSGKAKAAAGQ